MLVAPPKTINVGWPLAINRSPPAGGYAFGTGAFDISAMLGIIPRVAEKQREFLRSLAINRSRPAGGYAFETRAFNISVMLGIISPPIADGGRFCARGSDSDRITEYSIDRIAEWVRQLSW